MPRGRLLSEAGQLSGVPQDAGTFNFTIIATDAAQCTGNNAYTLRVLPEATIADTGVTTGTAPGFAPRARTNTSRFSNEAAGKPVEFVVTLSAPSNERVTLFFATADGSAHAGENYQANSGTLIFAPGETEKRVSVMVLGRNAGREADG